MTSLPYPKADPLEGWLPSAPEVAAVLAVQLLPAAALESNRDHPRPLFLALLRDRIDRMAAAEEEPVELTEAVLVEMGLEVQWLPENGALLGLAMVENWMALTELMEDSQTLEEWAADLRKYPKWSAELKQRSAGALEVIQEMDLETWLTSLANAMTS
jgi:hypothetical protein